MLERELCWSGGDWVGDEERLIREKNHFGLLGWNSQRGSYRTASRGIDFLLGLTQTSQILLLKSWWKAEETVSKTIGFCQVLSRWTEGHSLWSAALRLQRKTPEAAPLCRCIAV